ncbi:MAG: Sua5/YciO/YrdC/YwlC family protein, partial [Pseudomonadota bacterium]
MATAQRVRWNGGLQPQSVDTLSRPGGVIVSPTKVGYIIVATDAAGLERKFDAKERKRNKPGVVLCGSMEQLREIAQLNDEIDAFYQAHWDQDILLGCILPWRDEGRRYIPDDGSDELMMDNRGTSCFVIKYGTPSEHVAAKLWADRSALCF